MNDPIRELWAQCVVKHTKTPMNWQDVADEFAELIVQECMNLRNDPHIQPFLHGWKHLRDDNSHKEYATGWVEGTEVYRCGIRDYFGVEE